MLVPAGSSIFFLREHRFAVRCRVVTLRQLLWTLFILFMLSACLLHIFLYYIFFINIGCATLYYLSMMYVTVYNMSFNSNCRILAAELNYRFTEYIFKICYPDPAISKWTFLIKILSPLFQEILPIMHSGLAARLQTHTLCSLNISNNSLYNAFYYMCRKITSHWQPVFC